MIYSVLIRWKGNSGLLADYTYSSIVASNYFNAIDVTSSFDQLKVIYKKVGNNESQAFGVWQLLSESERTRIPVLLNKRNSTLTARSA